MAITNAITDLVGSIYELFASFIGAVYTIIHSFVAGIFGLFNGFFIFIGDIFKGMFDVAGGVGKFVSGNVVILAVLVAALYGYNRFVAPQQGRRPVINGVGNGLKTQ